MQYSFYQTNKYVLIHNPLAPRGFLLQVLAVYKLAHL